MANCLFRGDIFSSSFAQLAPHELADTLLEFRPHGFHGKLLVFPTLVHLSETVFLVQLVDFSGIISANSTFLGLEVFAVRSSLQHA